MLRNSSTDICHSFSYQSALSLVEIGFLALFGYNICDVAKEVQENVKSSIESMTGLRVVEINVHVGGVTFKPSASAEEKAEPAPSETETPAETADAE